MDYADSTLRGFTKERLIDEIKCLRQNLDGAYERIENQFNILQEADLNNVLKPKKLRDVNFKWYVLNADSLASGEFDEYPYRKDAKVKPFNIFDFYTLNKETNDNCRKYYCKIISYEEFVEELRKDLMYSLWSKRECEIHATDLNGFERGDKPDKFDCYMQALPNLDPLAKTVLWQFRNWQK